ncbi:PREDICTED: biotin carboxyl carrier protein of acetyl-CoA carboxylase 1, chloroplastic [Fragaria vesca subsp. vesca]|uniref:biotin carboxyl carrier protein of acetyl-CoA carboxylase 1, chloroplastic n=1 Tax=Fragaria vesca subsp. vesca TaxID=101020 RepID=UPI0002C35241|nr:PREDICTED: biotin carboxyl carrier protein of acetyl-CoA carboxylase 1, chloroplastic [Fragaria vesca subsp. vesca]
MASCSLGTSYPKITNLNLGRTRVGISQSYGVRTWTLQRPQLYSGLSISRRSEKVSHVHSAPSLEIISATSSDDGSKESDSGSASPRIPNFDEIQSLLTTICDTTSVAEVQLKLGGFRLHVVRELTENVSTPPPSIPAPVSVSTPAEVPESNGSVPTQSLAITRAESSSRDIQTLLDKAADEGLVLIQSPRVGSFRRSRTIKGKRAPPSCKEKQIVKEGQVICYIEQLGGELPIESDVAGEVIKILREDGEPVGYGDALVAVLPSFPGIKKLQ